MFFYLSPLALLVLELYYGAAHACLRLNQFFPTLTAGMLRYHLVFLLFSLDTVLGGVKCPANEFGHQLECAFECCPSMQEGVGHYCCGAEEKALILKGTDHRAERFVAGYGTTLQVDYTLLIIGLIISIAVSVCLSFLCCLLCNGCWLHRRRNPQQYESVREENGWYPICCGFGIPMGTVVFSTHPPHYRDESDIYHGSSTSSTSLPSSKQRVRFNPDGTPRGVLKNGHDSQGYRD